MNLEELRNYCLSKSGVTEKTPFGKFSRRFESVLVFYVKNHMFCSVDMDDFTYVNVKSTSEEIALLEERHTSVGSTLNPAMKEWIRLDIGGDLTDSEIYRLIDEAYGIVSRKYHKGNR